MNVLHLISSRLGFFGAERVVVTLSAALGELGVNTVVGAFYNTVRGNHVEILNKASSCGLKTERLVCNCRLDWKAVDGLRNIVKHHDINVIHCHGIKPLLYSLLAACDGVAVVNTCHLWTFDSIEEWGISALERCMLHASDRVVVVSDQILPQLRRFGLKAKVIFNGIDLVPVYSPASDFRQKMGWSGRPVIGAIARLTSQKGLRNLLLAAPEVLRTNPNAIFLLVGDGPERQALEAQARRLGIHNAVVFLGIREDIPELLASMDALAMPSLSEGLPMALLEAMASEKAVVATRVGAIPHVIQDRVNGIMVAPNDVSGLTAALLDILKYSEFRLALGHNARKTVEAHFSAATMATQYLEVYCAATSKHRQAVSI